MNIRHCLENNHIHRVDKCSDIISIYSNVPISNFNTVRSNNFGKPTGNKMPNSGSPCMTQSLPMYQGGL